MSKRAPLYILDPGHRYQLPSQSDTFPQILQFVKKVGPGFPGNTTSYDGTLMQDVLRALIDRVKYVDNQIPHETNQDVLYNLRDAIYSLEARAAERHNATLDHAAINFDILESYQPSENGHLTQFWITK